MSAPEIDNISAEAAATADALDVNDAQQQQPQVPPVTFNIDPELQRKLEAQTDQFFRFKTAFEFEVDGNLSEAITSRGKDFLGSRLAKGSANEGIHMGELSEMLEYATSSWLDNGAVKNCDILLKEETGKKNDGDVSTEVDRVVVQVTLKPAKQVREIGVFTTDTVMPELRLGLRNALKGLVNFQLNYVPPAAQRHSWSGSVVANAPPVGDRAEVSFGLRKENRFMHPADVEKIEELKCHVESKSTNFLVHQAWTLGFERRQMAAVDAAKLPRDITRDFSQSRKVYARHTFHYKGAVHHAHPMLNMFYPLPVGGADVYWTNEVALPLLGSAANFFKTEIQATKSLLLHPLVSLDINARLGAACPLNSSSRLVLNDRFFLTWRHLRGYKTVGPSTADLHTTGETTTRFASTGGNALWALSASLNMPFWLYPNNGIAAMHLFANAGNLAMFNSVKDVTSGWKNFFTNSYAAVGAGLIITKIPLIGMLPNGRIEVNASLPVRWDDVEGLCFNATNKYLADRVRFGIVWCSTMQN